MDQDYRARPIVCNAAEKQRLPRRPRKPAGETREEILNTAEQLFRSHGFANVAIADIATELSMSPANVFKHFRSKASLVDAIATRAIEETVASLRELSQSEPAPERLCALAHHLMQMHVTGRMDAPFVFEMILFTITEELDCGERFRKMVVEMITDIIETGIRDGVYHVQDVPRFANATFDALACVIHPVMTGFEKADIMATRCKDVVTLIDAALRLPLVK